MHMTFENRLTILFKLVDSYIIATITRCDLSAAILFKLVDSSLSNPHNNVASIHENRKKIAPFNCSVTQLRMTTNNCNLATLLCKSTLIKIRHGTVESEKNAHKGSFLMRCNNWRERT